MTAHAEAEICPQCGAPLEVDEDGHCKWCRAVIAVPVSGQGGSDEPLSVGGDTSFDLCDDGLGLPLPVFPLLSGLWMLGMEAGVQRELANPTLLAEVKAVAARVHAAGERAADAGLSDATMPNWLKDYTPEEIWCFRLARDLLVWLANLDGVDRNSARLAISTASDYTWSHHVKKALDKYGPGPADLQGLRARIAVDVPAQLAPAR